MIGIATRVHILKIPYARTDYFDSTFHTSNYLYGRYTIQYGSKNINLTWNMLKSKSKQFIWIVISWVVTLYSLVSGYKCFGGTYCLHLQG
jgi:hypothetical protein